MVHGLIGIVLRRAAPLKLLNYKLTRRSRSTASVIRFATLESRLSRFSRPCKVVSRTTIDFSPDLAPRIRRAKNHPPDYFSFFSHLLFPPPDEVRFTARQTTRWTILFESPIRTRESSLHACLLSLVFVHHSSPSPSNVTKRYNFREKRVLKNESRRCFRETTKHLQQWRRATTLATDAHQF